MQVFMGLILAVSIIFIFVFFYFIKLWIRALASGAHVSIPNLIGMKLRNIPPTIIIDGSIMATKAGIEITTNDLEAHFLAGGSVTNVVRALISADKANIKLAFKQAAAIDLAGRDVLSAVHMSVNPKVIDCPDPTKGRDTIDGIAKNGIQVRAKARVTVRTNIDRLVGGATEETIIARVGEGIVTTIGSAVTHKEVLENPDKISKMVLEKGLDSGTAFEILSIDIADVDIGANIGAKLQTDQAEADKRVAQAIAETRRAAAVATEQEMKARVQEMRAKVIEAEAEIPKSIAHAFHEGNLGIMDYYNLKNVMADTSMRETIANKDKEKDKGKPHQN
ncbi:MAG: flotillin-like protein FloA [Candidatus Ancaeobacter aquaticus]|nr:flotillin-like protein FloA [Candidatus Ancaeobacter aquaticus]